MTSAAPPPDAPRTSGDADPDTARLERRHLRIGWWMIVAFLSLGLVIDALHGFKVGWYLDANNEARRLMWTLSHAHGTLFGLIHLGFAYSVGRIDEFDARRRRLASGLLTTGTLGVPAAFFAAGISAHGGDPGFLVVLVAPTATLLLAATILVAIAAKR